MRSQNRWDLYWNQTVVFQARMFIVIQNKSFPTCAAVSIRCVGADVIAGRSWQAA